MHQTREDRLLKKVASLTGKRQFHQEDAEKKRLEAEKELQKLQGDEAVPTVSRMVGHGRWKPDYQVIQSALFIPKRWRSRFTP